MPNLILDNAIMAQSMLEKLKAEKKQERIKVWRRIRKYASLVLSDFNGDIKSKTKSEKIIKQFKHSLKPIFDNEVNNLITQLQEVSLQLAMIEYASFTQIFGNDVVNKVDENSLNSSLQNRPLSLKNWNGPLYLPQFIAAWGILALTQITNSVTKTFAESGSIRSLEGLLYSDEAAGYSVISKIVNDYDAIMSTALQHVQSVAATEFYSVNHELVDKEEFAAILDSHTSVICRSLDGLTYPVGEGPRPPLHFGCRSRMLPVINQKFITSLNEGKVDSSVYGEETYYQWLNRQAPKRQDIILGPTRGALFRDGGLTPEQFAKLQLHKNFKPMTLEEMKKVIPDAFERAGLN